MSPVAKRALHQCDGPRKDFKKLEKLLENLLTKPTRYDIISPVADKTAHLSGGQKSF